jgi:hypothetical protein
MTRARSTTLRFLYGLDRLGARLLLVELRRLGIDPVTKQRTPMPNPLDPQVCRCHDSDCPERSWCRRWTERNTPSRHPRLASSASLAEIDPGGHCVNRIPLEQEYDR